MQCPKCGYEQPQSIECRSCGIIINKYNKRSLHTPPISSRTPSSSPEKSSGIPVKTYIVTTLVVFFLIYAALDWWKSQPVIHGPGSVAPDPPQQTETEKGSFTFKDHRMIPLADFYVNARVLSKKNILLVENLILHPLIWHLAGDRCQMRQSLIK